MSHRESPLAVSRFLSRRKLGSSLSGRVRAGPRRRLTRAWLVEPLEGRVVLATIQVTSLADTGAGTLRAAIEQANLDAAGDTITFAPSVTGTNTLSTALPDLVADINIVGPGASLLTVARSSAAGTPEFSVFTVEGDADVELAGLEITGGSTSPSSLLGGGIANYGTLMVTNCTITGNLGDGSFDGGGIDNSGTLTVANCTISDNSADGSPGGGIYSNAVLSVIDSTISGNSGGGGGGIFNFGTATVINSTVSDNTAAGNVQFSDGGGIDNKGTMTVTNSTIAGNYAVLTSGPVYPPANHIISEGVEIGGGIYNTGSLSVTNSTVSGNLSNEGGGICNTGAVSITDCTLSGNSAVSGGGIYNANLNGQTAEVTASMSIFASPAGGNLVLVNYGVPGRGTRRVRLDGPQPLLRHARRDPQSHRPHQHQPPARPACRQRRPNSDPGPAPW